MTTKKTTTSKAKPKQKTKMAQEVQSIIMIESLAEIQNQINLNQHEINKQLIKNIRKNNNDILLLSIVLVVVVSVVLISD